LHTINDREFAQKWESVETAYQHVNVIASNAGKWHFGAHTWQLSKRLAKILHRFSQVTSLEPGEFAVLNFSHACVFIYVAASVVTMDEGTSQAKNGRASNTQPALYLVMQD